MACTSRVIYGKLNTWTIDKKMNRLATVGRVHHPWPQVPRLVWATIFPWLSGHFCVNVAGSGQTRQPERVDITDTERGTHGPIRASLRSFQPGELSAPSRATNLESLILMSWEFGLHPRESPLQMGGGQATHSPPNSSAPNSGLLCSAASSP